MLALSREMDPALRITSAPLPAMWRSQMAGEETVDQLHRASAARLGGTAVRIPNFCEPELRRFYKTGRNTADIAKDAVKNSAVEERRDRAAIQKRHFKEVANRLRISVRLLRRVAYHLPELFLEELVTHGAVSIPKIGTLKLKRYKRTRWNSVVRGKVGNNPQRADIVKPAMIRAHFKPAKALKATIALCMEEGLIANDLLLDARQRLYREKWRDQPMSRLMRYTRYKIVESNRACPEEEAERRLRHPARS